jgi:hypothetical protein
MNGAMQPGRGYDVEASVTGTFRDARDVNHAVRKLTAQSIPTDVIRVFVVDEQGRRRREIMVEDEAGALKGALIGGAVGAVIGLGVVILVPLIYGPANLGFLSVSSLFGALRAIGICAVAGVPLGAILGMGRWEGRKRIAKVGVSGGRVQVVVESEELAELARETLEAAGAESVERQAVHR